MSRAFARGRRSRRLGGHGAGFGVTAAVLTSGVVAGSTGGGAVLGRSVAAAGAGRSAISSGEEAVSAGRTAQPATTPKARNAITAAAAAWGPGTDEPAGHSMVGQAAQGACAPPVSPAGAEAAARSG